MTTVDQNFGEIYQGIEVSSRYDLEFEVSAIKRAIDLIPIPGRFVIQSIFCDSKASACYLVDICSGIEAKLVADEIDYAFRTACGGHNGIQCNSDGNSVFSDPWWPEVET